MTEEQRARVLTTEDLPTLEQWLRQSIHAEPVDRLLGSDPPR